MVAVTKHEHRDAADELSRLNDKHLRETAFEAFECIATVYALIGGLKQINPDLFPLAFEFIATVEVMKQNMAARLKAQEADPPVERPVEQAEDFDEPCSE